MAAAGSICADLSVIVGAARVSSDPQVRARFAIRGSSPGCIVSPPSSEEVAQVLKYASDHGLAVIPCRNATKLSLGNPPRKYDIALSLKEMNNVWHYEPSDLTISVEAGMKFGDFQNFVGRNDLWLPLDPEGGALASIGGILATNSTGPLRHAYGSPRDMTLGMKVATVEGKIIKTGGRVVKNVAGYDVSKLLIGSHGTLGVILEANFKLFPLPAGRMTLELVVESLDAARNLRRSISNSGLPVLRMVLGNELATDCAKMSAGKPLDTHAIEFWIEAGGSERVCQRIRRDVETLAREAGVQTREADEAEAGNAWEHFADFRRRALESYPGAIVARISLPVSHQEHFLARSEKFASEMKTPLAWLSHAGTGIVQLAILDTLNASRTTTMLKILHKAAAENGGTLVNVDAGPRELPESGAWGECGDDLPMMKELKRMWDPHNVLSPGRFVGEI